MKLVAMRTIAGPNVYTNRPVLVATLDLEDKAEMTSAALPAFTNRLLARLPGLAEHRCSRGHPGGFVERLREGTYMGHVVEHAALELSGHAGIDVGFGRTVSSARPGCYDVIVAYANEEGMRFLLHAALELVDSIARGDGSFPLEDRLQEARERIADTELGPSTSAIVDAAERRGIPARRIGAGSLVQLGYGRAARMIQATTTSATRAIAVEIACDKELTKTVLRRAGVPVPAGDLAATEEEAVRAFEALGGIPVAVKPVGGNHGRGISLGVSTPEGVREAFRRATEVSNRVVVEEFWLGRDYRVLVVNGVLTAASERVPASVTGDGRRTIASLVEEKNADPRRGLGHEKPLTRIALDDAALASLARRGLTPESVPLAGVLVRVHDTANISTGGTARDVTDRVHQDVRRACERAARAIGLDVCGIDLVLPDIACPIAPCDDEGEGGGGVIEVNAAPGLRMHHFPSEGAPRDAGGAIVDMLFPEGMTGRIPICAITGTNGKTTTTRMIAHILASSGLRAGVTTSCGVFIGGERILSGDTTGPRSADAVLSDPTVEVAVLETARGGMIRGGLAYDRADVAVLTNIQADHLGQDGIDTLEDLAKVKALVVERVRAGGTIIANAEDDNVAAVLSMPRTPLGSCRLVLFALDPEHPRVRRHLAEGGRAFLLRGDRLVEESLADGARAIVLAGRLPITFGGTADFQVANALAAAAAARALGISREGVAHGLRGFAPPLNPGRLGLWRAGSGTLLLDFGHNPDAFLAIGRMLRRWRAPRRTAIIGVPGDRSDAVIELAGRVAARSFDRLIIREDRNLRGRPPGQAAELLRRAVAAEAPDRACLVVLDEEEALALALSDLLPDEIVVLFYDELSRIETTVAVFGCEPISVPSRAFFGEAA